MMAKARCPGCRRLYPDDWFLCDLCWLLVPARERTALVTAVNGKEDERLLTVWMDALTQAVQLTRLADRRLLLNTKGPAKSRLSFKLSDF